MRIDKTIKDFRDAERIDPPSNHRQKSGKSLKLASVSKLQSQVANSPAAQRLKSLGERSHGEFAIDMRQVHDVSLDSGEPNEVELVEEKV